MIQILDLLLSLSLKDRICMSLCVCKGFRIFRDEPRSIFAGNSISVDFHDTDIVCTFNACKDIQCMYTRAQACVCVCKCFMLSYTHGVIMASTNRYKLKLCVYIYITYTYMYIWYVFAYIHTNIYACPHIIAQPLPLP